MMSILDFMQKFSFLVIGVLIVSRLFNIMLNIE